MEFLSSSVLNVDRVWLFIASKALARFFKSVVLGSLWGVDPEHILADPQEAPPKVSVVFFNGMKTLTLVSALINTSWIEKLNCRARNGTNAAQGSCRTRTSAGLI